MPRLATRIETFRGRVALVPAYRQGVDVLEQVQARGQLLQATVLKYTRSVQRENWYWGLVHHVADGLGIGRHALHAEIKFKAELIQDYILGSTGPVAILKSTRREEMDDAEHRAYVDTAVEIIFQHYLPGVRRADVLRVVDEMVGPRPR